VIHARATIEPSERAWDLLDRLTKLYMSPEDDFPAPRGPGLILRYEVERVGGVGPWALVERAQAGDQDARGAGEAPLEVEQEVTEARLFLI
jgi:hypothetical protein